MRSNLAKLRLKPSRIRGAAPLRWQCCLASLGRPAGLTHPDRPDLTIWSATIDVRFFDVLGQYPLVGGFSADHFNQPAPAGEARPAIVSHGFWRQWLAADPSVLGRRVEMVGGIRLALGSARPTIIWLVTKQTFVPVGVGAAAGLVAALLSARAMTVVLYGVSPYDVATLLLAGLMLLATTVAASALPSWARTDPMQVLRAE